jgi:hypothetical protein
LPKGARKHFVTFAFSTVNERHIYAEIHVQKQEAPPPPLELDLDGKKGRFFLLFSSITNKHE